MARMKYFFIFAAMALCFPSLSGCGDSKNLKELKGVLKKLNEKEKEKEKLDICLKAPNVAKGKYKGNEKGAVKDVWRKIKDICNPLLKKNNKPTLQDLRIN